MRPQRFYDPHQQFYALTAFRYAGVEYKRGDKFDIGEMPNRKRIQFFQNWYIGYAEDFRDNKASIKEVSIKESTTKEKVEDKPATEEKPKKRSARRTKKSEASESSKNE